SSGPRGKGYGFKARLVSKRLIRLNIPNHVLKVPGRSRKPRQLELEETESDLVLLGVHLVEHQHKNHALRRPTVVEWLGKPRIVVAPRVQLEVVVGVVLQVGRR